MSQIGVYANRSLVNAPATSTAREIARLMEKHHIGSVIIMKGGVIHGLVTERDLARRVVGEGRDANRSVDDIVLTDVPRMPPDTSVQEAVETMRKTGCRYLFAVEGDQVVGVVSMQDLIRALTALVEAEAQALKKYISGDM